LPHDGLDAPSALRETARRARQLEHHVAQPPPVGIDRLLAAYDAREFVEAPAP
jgi:pantothenate kinase type III